MIGRNPVELKKYTMRGFQKALKADPAADLRSLFSLNYDSIMKSKAKKEPPKPPQPLEFRTKIDHVENAEVIFSLSDDVVKLLSQYSGEDSELEGEPLVTSLKRLIWESPKLWESVIRGVVLKCNDKIALKVIRQPADYTEYTTLQYLAENLPEIPIPRPHGLIRFAPFTAYFMSYIPSMTLTEAWPNLDHEGKLCVKKSLKKFS